MPDSPAALVCSRFGGSAILARLLGVHRSTTHRWVKQGWIPPGEIDRVLDTARRRRIRLSRREVLLGR